MPPAMPSRRSALSRNVARIITIDGNEIWNNAASISCVPMAAPLVERRCRCKKFVCAHYGTLRYSVVCKRADCRQMEPCQPVRPSVPSARILSASRMRLY